MTEHRQEFDPVDLAAAKSLLAHRPSPSAPFRGALGRQLQDLDPGYGHRPARLWIHAGVLAGAGALLVLLGLLISTGAI